MAAELVKSYKGRKAVAEGEEFDSSPNNIKNKTKEITLGFNGSVIILAKT